jgi:hypothetical protein
VQVTPVSYSNVYTPVQPVTPVTPVKRDDADADNAGKVRAANPPGVGTLLDIEA